MKKFSSQIATTKKQSDRLMKLGLKPETADMCRIYTDEYGNNIPEKCVSINPEGELIYVDNMDYYYLTCDLLPRESHLYDHSYKDDAPAWSLFRLLELMPSEVHDPKPGFEPHHPELIKHKLGYNLSIRRSTADCLVGTHIEKNPIECCVSMIEWLIKNGHFSKEYLA